MGRKGGNAKKFGKHHSLDPSHVKATDLVLQPKNRAQPPPPESVLVQKEGCRMSVIHRQKWRELVIGRGKGHLGIPGGWEIP